MFRSRPRNEGLGSRPVALVLGYSLFRDVAAAAALAKAEVRQSLARDREPVSAGHGV